MKNFTLLFLALALLSTAGCGSTSIYYDRYSDYPYYSSYSSYYDPYPLGGLFVFGGGGGYRHHHHHHWGGGGHGHRR